MNTLIKSTLLSSISAGGRVKTPRQPSIWCGDPEKGYMPGDLVDANGIVDFILDNDIIHDDPNFQALEEKIAQEIIDRAAAVNQEAEDRAAAITGVYTEIQRVIGSLTPETLDTLEEIAAALQNDPQIITKITNRLTTVESANVRVSGTTLYVNAPNVSDPWPLPEYIDLGLPSGTLWATMNVGAESETGVGNRYGYGHITQYSDSDTIYSGIENPLDAQHDVANADRGGDWHIPTKAQMLELIDNTAQTYTTIDGVAGCKFTAANDKYVFLPANGWKSVMGEFDGFGAYWTSTPNSSNSNRANYLKFENGTVEVSDLGGRGFGMSIRPVKNSNV